MHNGLPVEGARICPGSATRCRWLILLLTITQTVARVVFSIKKIALWKTTHVGIYRKDENTNVIRAKITVLTTKFEYSLRNLRDLKEQN